ncbi:MAG: alkane 1-monooxygenase [Chitinophagaceae bacterium]|nr:alkane 1-monooxygenase [Chitinophagaceae bacterium]
MKIHSAQNSLRYFLSLTPGAFVIAGNLLGGWWSISNIIYTMLLLIGIEYLTKENKKVNDVDDGTVPNVVLSLHVLFHTLTIFTLLYGIYAGILVGKFIWIASVSTGISGGIEGINSAHELIHRKQWYARIGGIWNLLLVNYSHFYIEHIRGHHRFIGTPRDSATALYGESFYHFFARTVPAQFRSAFQLEADRLRKINQHGGGIRNLVVQLVVIQIMLCIIIFYLAGNIALLAYLHQSVIAFFLLEYVNYIEHYGLQRSEREKVNATHSWQCDLPISRFALIELSRHSDHHITASKPYYKLINYDDSPVLPAGYFGSFYWAMFPPLWFKKVNPVLDAYLEKKNGVSR